MGRSEDGAAPVDIAKESCPLCAGLEAAVPLQQGLALTKVLQRSADGCVVCRLLADAVLAINDEGYESEALIVGWDTMRLQGLRIVVGEAASGQFLYGIDVYAPSGQPVPWHVVGHPERPVAISGATDSDGAMRQVRSWLNTCSEKHSCRRPVVSRLPTRVLDVRNPQHVFLYSPEAEETGQYACLSHCWGSFQTLRTTTANVLQHEDDIYWDDLPKVFQDTIMVVTKLGIPFLWIDSLCIIQNSAEDWQRESAKMADIYANSTVTIAASAATGDSESLFATSPDIHLSRVLKTRGYDNIYVRRTLAHGYGPVPLPLMTRAWVLQERLLSPRVVHFTREEVVWECMEKTTCECGCIRSLWSPGHVPFDKDLLYERLLHGASRADVRDRWRRLVEEYSRLKLTFDRDRLPAVSGAARRFSAALNCRYLAGLWSLGLLSDLLWERKVPSDAPKRLDSLPSWSWVSLGTEVVYDECQSVEEIAVVLEAQCFPCDGEDDFGEVSGGKVLLSAPLLPASAPYFVQRAGTRLVLDNPEAGDYISCFAVKLALRRHVYSSNSTEEMWLVLKCVDDSNHEYKRVGLLKVPVLDQWQGVGDDALIEPQTILLA